MGVGGYPYVHASAVFQITPLSTHRLCVELLEQHMVVVCLRLPFQLVMERLNLGMSVRGRSGNTNRRYVYHERCALHHTTPDSEQSVQNS